jgi:hypothetical protein
VQLEIPTEIERHVSQFAQEQRISRDEAILRLIEKGLSVARSPSQPLAEPGIGLFGDSEDAALLDEVVALAYEERKRPSKNESSL